MNSVEWSAEYARVPRIHVPTPLVEGATLTLPEGPARHLTRVLRMLPGAPLVIFDGNGQEAGVRLAEVTRKQVTVSVEALWPGQGESPLMIHLGQAVSKGDRMDYAIQKAVELGVSCITPIYTQRTEVRLKGEREARKHAHWQAVAASASEQCGRAVVPSVHPPQALATWLEQRDETLRLMLHLATGNPFQCAEAPASVALLIGPEGGLAEDDLKAAENADFTPLTLGPRVLRTETAPVVALSLLQYHFGDFQP
ncbi:16S rRNA (uracil(1498)-N(3))-methyltransferase [Halomonas sp. TBZ9]|uniref:Ribosomal RNA small subunit methyltransferase E n=1 Tax=Vreelandella azerica TaxID=2732867 RepID=A0A7Y3XAF9_9GAMM|nr:16S rRNA (uracil(1498)-N(3))-methyltransferase [Halomonas azerica]NOG32727.1 16S rRNA (uracil(1498)-N(3))-methyltransferase [Halomonas azerica]